ncbi:MAG: arylsulfatase [Bacteroidia bacterium]|nr:arylsulfatase [Bacteroidia bacterium]
MKMYFTRLISAVLFLLFACKTPPPPQDSRPNIILIMVDDMGWSDIQPYGGEVNTPNLNRLAAEGMRFTRFYNNAKCTTTRASLVTGLYPRRDQKDEELLRTNMITFAELLKEAGYQTSLSGKWHLGRDSVKHPIHRGFDEFYGLLDGACNFFNPAAKDPDYKGSKYRVFAHNDQQITEFPDDFYTTDAFTEHAIETIRRYSQEESPFLIHITYNAPHYPIQAWPEDIKKYEGKYRMGWEELRKNRYERQLAMGLIDSTTFPLSGTDSQAYDWNSADQEFEDLRMAVYAAMIDRVDQNIGRLLQTLEETGEAENTLILFLSDNGGCAEEPGGRDPRERTPGPGSDYVAVGPAWGWAQNAPFRRYKAWMHEGGITTPFIAWWPGHIPADTITRETGHIIDILPTFAEIAGVNYPQTYNGHQILPVEGISLLPVLRGQKRPGHDELYWEYTGNRAMQQGNWKIVWDKLVKEWELYDLSTDRTETRNLAATYPEKVQQMADKWAEWAGKTGILKENPDENF